MDLDPARTLIGGPNESGKSTLVEAAHRAFFLRSKVTGDAQKSMVSTLYQGYPEVEVRFESKGEIYRIAKRFSGQTGTTRLTREGGQTWQQDEAEAKLNQLLGVADVGGGRGVADRAAAQWAHLWIRQGQGGENPSTYAESQKQSLLARLKDEGGSAAMESELDSRIAAAIAQRNAGQFGQRGGVIVGSELDLANKSLATATEALEQARKNALQLQEAVQSFTRADSLIREKENELDGLSRSKRETSEKLEEARRLSHLRDLEDRDTKQASAQHEELIRAERQIEALVLQITGESQAIKPKEDIARDLEVTVAEKRSKLETAIEHHRELDQRLREARATLEFAKAWRDQFDCQERLGQLKTLSLEVQRLRDVIQKLKVERAQLPELTKKSLSQLKALQSAHLEACIAQRAMASGITVKTSKLSIKVGGEDLGSGESRVITAETEVEVGDDTRLTITPGGGTSLRDANAMVEESCLALESALATAGITTIEEATRICEQRQELDSHIEVKDAELRGMNADSIEKDLAVASSSVEGATAEVLRRTGMVGVGVPAPADQAAAKDLVSASADALDGLEADELRSAASLDAAKKSVQDSEDELARHLRSIEDGRTELQNLKVKLTTLEESLGVAAERKEKRDAFSNTLQEAQQKLAQTEAALIALQPDALEADLDRFGRAFERTRSDIGEAEMQRAVAQNLLSRDGSSDPAEALAFAEAEFESARRRQLSVERKANAIRMLSSLFAAEQRSLSDQFTRPLADRVSGYLQQLFGSGAKAQVEMIDREFKTLMLSRDGVAFDFDVLSGGAREQVAAAFRLAMAEILAADHDGCLPVVFDDAFTNSDPSRVQTLQRMLDLAARRGLQVILLTCDPSDYASLGATTVSMA